MLEGETNIVSADANVDDAVEAMLKKRKKKKFERAKLDARVFSASKKLQRRFSWKKTTVKILASGVMLGNWFKNFLTGQDVDAPNYLDYRLDQYEMNSTQVLASILGTTAQSGNNFSELTEKLRQQGKTPKDLTVSQNIAMANLNASLASSYVALGLGSVEVKAPVIGKGNQAITSCKKFDGAAYTFESISKGMLPVATCAFLKKDSSDVNVYSSKKIDIDAKTGLCSADWGETSTPYKLAKYVDLNGMEPYRLFPYVISSKTILDEAKVEVQEETYNEKQVFAFTINLDPVTSVLRYYKQVMQTSGIDDFPTFESVSVTILLDADWNYVRSEVVESYVVKYPVGRQKINAPCKGTLNTDYVFNGPVTLPIGGAQ